MLKFELVVTPTAEPVLDKMTFESVRFGVYQPTGESYVELRCWATSSANPKAPGEDRILRLYESADTFLDDFCINHEAAVKAWVQGQADEKPRVPKEEEAEEISE